MRAIKILLVSSILIVTIWGINVDNQSLGPKDQQPLPIQEWPVTEDASQPPVSQSEIPLALRIIFVIFFMDCIRMWSSLLIGSIFYRVKPPGKTTFMPKVSIIIPAWNEEMGIRRTAQSLIENGYPNYEIIVTNDGSTDGTSNRVMELARLHPGIVKLVDQNNAGKADALNHGLQHATGEIIICVDADTFVHPSAIRNIVRWFEDPSVDAVVGRVLIGNTRTWLGKLQYFEYLLGFHLKRTQHVLNTIFILSGALCSYRKSAFDRLEGYTNYSKTEDMDLSLQMRQLNLKLVYAYDALCSTEGASDMEGLINQRMRWRHGGLVCLFHHRNLFFNSHTGWVLGFYELPFAVYGIIQISIYPLILLLAYGAPIITGDYVYLGLLYISILVNYIIILLTPGVSKKMLRYFPLLTFIMQQAMLIEHIALLKAFYRFLTHKELSWTNWKRQGIRIEAPYRRKPVH